MTQRIRPAKPDDAPFLAWVVLTAARSHLARDWFDIALDRPEPECLVFLRALTVTRARSRWHHSRFTCTFEPHGAAWTLENIATLPRYRKRGLASDLIRYVLPEGKRLGMDEAQITFLIGNDPAERAYANAGFQHAGDRRSTEFETATGVAGIRRYVEALPRNDQET